ncbi:small cell adhesion glycoprotein [Bufo gargarizans]|uniref:small cell adhesion glycoprotein n=1 Tax=Bufo gargarizans TaxID=30331 RepID=UPI001CF40C0E|nr:small cell adhesion glycoprotein [Bufo gargarizans]
MVLLTTVTFPTGQSPSDMKETTSSSSGMDSFDKALVGGVIAAVLLTLLIVLVLAAVYLYKHKGSYRTHETDEEGEAHKALQVSSDSGEGKQEYFM